MRASSQSAAAAQTSATAAATASGAAPRRGNSSAPPTDTSSTRSKAARSRQRTGMVCGSDSQRNRPVRSTRPWWKPQPLALPERKRAYSVSACATSSREGLVRTDM